MDETTDATPLRVLTPALSPDELAAVVAVVEAAVEEELDELHSGVRINPSAWERSQRTVRAPLHPGAGRWRGFSA